VLWGRVIAATTGSDSFFVDLDSQEEDVWQVLYEGGQNPDWTWDRVSNQGSGTHISPEDDPRIFSLLAGTHIISFRGRERETKLDRILLTNDLDYDPTYFVFHRADNNKNGCIETNELFAFIDLWKQNQVTIGELMEAIAIWKTPCT